MTKFLKLVLSRLVETIGNENDDNDDNDDYSTSVSLGDDGGWRDDLPSGQPQHRFSMKYGEGRDNSQYLNGRFAGPNDRNDVRRTSDGRP